jgi:AAA domain
MTAAATYCKQCHQYWAAPELDGLCWECATGSGAGAVGATDSLAVRSRFAEVREESLSNRLGALSRTESLELIAQHRPDWRVTGILATDDYGVLAGPKGVGKTYALIDLAVAVALGESWFGRFPTNRAKVLLLTSEDSRAKLWRRADAVARPLNRDPGELEGWLFIHPFSFSAVGELDRLRAELAAIEPGLVLLDPAYRYMGGVKAQLFDMGAVLTPLQEACAKSGAPLVVGHHYNKQEGRLRGDRLSGSGLYEWARVLITMEAPALQVGQESVTATVEITGNSLETVMVTLRRSVVALDESPNPELAYAVEVLAEGEQAARVRLQTASDRVYAVLPEAPESLTIQEIGDAVANDSTGKGGLKASTIRSSLNRDLKGQVDSMSDAGQPTRWWRM